MKKYLFLDRSIVVIIMLSFMSPVSAQSGRDRTDFFRQGEQNLEQEIEKFDRPSSDSDRLLNLDRNRHLEPVTFADGNLQISLPKDKQTIESQQLIEFDHHRINLKFLTTQSNQSEFIVAYSLNYLPELFLEQNKLLAKVKNLLLQGDRLSIVQEQEINGNNYPARQIKLESAKEAIKYRIYFLNKRLYILGLKQEKQQNVSQISNYFFDSFKILK